MQSGFTESLTLLHVVLQTWSDVISLGSSNPGWVRILTL